MPHAPWPYAHSHTAGKKKNMFGTAATCLGYPKLGNADGHAAAWVPQTLTLNTRFWKMSQKIWLLLLVHEKNHAQFTS